MDHENNTRELVLPASGGRREFIRSAAGLAVGYWKSTDDIVANWGEDRRWSPQMDSAERDRLCRSWDKAVTRTLNWVDDDVE